MRGDSTLIESRKRGRKPAVGVLIVVSDVAPEAEAFIRPVQAQGAHVLWITPGETPSLACCFDLNVLVYGDDLADTTVLRVCKLAEDYGARRVDGVVMDGWQIKTIHGCH